MRKRRKILAVLVALCVSAAAAACGRPDAAPDQSASQAETAGPEDIAEGPEEKTAGPGSMAEGPEGNTAGPESMADDTPEPETESFTIEPQPGRVFKALALPVKEGPGSIREYSIEIRPLSFPGGTVQRFSFRSEVPPEEMGSCLKSEDINSDGSPDLVVARSEWSRDVFFWDRESLSFSLWPYGGLLADYRVNPEDRVICNRVPVPAGERYELYRAAGDRLLLLRAFETRAAESGEAPGACYYSGVTGKTEHAGSADGFAERFQGDLTAAERSLSMIRQPAYEGVWSRTSVPRGCASSLAITEQTEFGFHYRIDSSYYSHTGTVEGTAYFLPGTGAFSTYEPQGLSGGGRITVTFLLLEGGGISVRCGDAGAVLGAGADVSIDGLYTSAEPDYTNAGVAGEHFTEKQLAEIKYVLGDEIYEEYFLFPMEYGVLTRDCEVEGNVPGRLWEVFLPTMGGYEFRILFGDNRYWYFANKSTGVITNDPRGTPPPDALADFLEAGRD